MKNKIFELYKDKSLTEFLEFKRDNPKENFVYVLQHPPANTGDPAVIGISCAIASDMTNGQFNLLKWDRREFKYYPIEFDLYQKG